MAWFSLAWPSWLRQSVPVSHRLGRDGEALAERTLRELGYRLLGRNVRCAGVRGEFDLVMRDRGTLVFVEVKTRRHRGLYPAASAVHAAKRATLLRLARRYCAQHGERGRYRFDVVSIYRPDSPRPEIEHVRYAFRERPGWRW